MALAGIATRDAVSPPPHMAFFIVSPVLSPGQPSNLPNIIADHLHYQQRVALVDFNSHQWYGLLSTITVPGQGKVSTLRLVLALHAGKPVNNVFEPPKALLAKLSPASVPKKDDMEVEITFPKPEKSALPVSPFGDPIRALQAIDVYSHEQMQLDLAEVNRLKKKLPDQKRPLYELYASTFDP
jgi:hypothetical protein